MRNETKIREAVVERVMVDMIDFHIGRYWTVMHFPNDAVHLCKLAVDLSDATMMKLVMNSPADFGAQQFRVVFADRLPIKSSGCCVVTKPFS